MIRTLHTAGSLLALLVLTAHAGRARAAFDHSHAELDEVLRAHVVDGNVSYGRLAADRAALDRYLESLRTLSTDELAGFGDAQASALWINAYNALTLKLILDHPGTASIRDIDGAWDRVRFDVAGRSLTLNEIEHEILRKRYADARLHMVLVCAARSCPELQSFAYTAASLDAQMDRASKGFVGDITRNRFDAETNSLHVSKIFEWYGGDFVQDFAQMGHGSDTTAAIRGFFAVYLEHAAVAQPDVSVTWLDYDWRLNGTW